MWEAGFVRIHAVSRICIHIYIFIFMDIIIFIYIFIYIMVVFGLFLWLSFGCFQHSRTISFRPYSGWDEIRPTNSQLRLCCVKRICLLSYIPSKKRRLFPPVSRGNHETVPTFRKMLDDAARGEYDIKMAFYT